MARPIEFMDKNCIRLTGRIVEDGDLRRLEAIDDAADSIAVLEATTTVVGTGSRRVQWLLTVVMAASLVTLPTLWSLLARVGALPDPHPHRVWDLFLLVLAGALYVLSAGLVLPSARVRDGRTTVLAVGFATALGFVVVTNALRLGGGTILSLLWISLATLSACAALFVALWRGCGPIVSFVVRNRWLMLASCLVPVIGALAVAVADIQGRTSAEPWARVFGLAALVLGLLATVGGLRVPMERRDGVHALLAMASATVSGAAAVTVVGDGDRLSSDLAVLLVCLGGLMVSGWLAMGYARGRRVTMAIEGIFEWAPQDDADEHLSEAAEALLRAAGAANEGPQHNQRVIQLAVGTAQELDLPPGRLRVIVLGALFHDVGTLAIPDEILNKPGALTEAERQLIESHVETGYAMASRVHLLWEAALAVRHHHEWWDGSGYPEGLSGDAIPIEARVIAVADMFDALTKPRPYREALTTDDALMMMRVEAGTHLDPDVFAAFSRYLRSFDNVLTFPMAEAES